MSLGEPLRVYSLTLLRFWICFRLPVEMGSLSFLLWLLGDMSMCHGGLFLWKHKPKYTLSSTSCCWSFFNPSNRNIINTEVQARLILNLRSSSFTSPADPPRFSTTVRCLSDFGVSQEWMEKGGCNFCFTMRHISYRPRKHFVSDLWLHRPSCYILHPTKSPGITPYYLILRGFQEMTARVGDILMHSEWKA